MTEQTASPGTIACAGRDLARRMEGSNFAEAYGKHVFCFEPVTPPDPADVAEMIWDILVATKFAPNGIRLAYHGEIVHPPQKVIRGKPYIDPRALVDGLRIDRTMNIVAIERYRSDIRTITTELEERFSVPCPANLYVSYAGSSGGYGPHRDLHDVVVLHLAGRKRWRIYPPRTSAVPIVRGDVSHEDLRGTPVEVTMTAGSALYVPAGFAHEVISDDGCCVHVTFGISVLRWHDLIETLLDGADDPSLYERIPEDREDVAKQFNERVLPRLLRMFGAEAIERVVERSSGFSKLARLAPAVRHAFLASGKGTER